jgi:phosphatidylserine/phosphatidylglycerophosphate/cardiolipin synthase-like enzyme
VGSANLTEAAFSTNREIVGEFRDAGSATEFFDKYWRKN